MRDQSNWMFVEIINKTENFKVYIHIEIMSPRDLLPLKKGWSEIHAKSSNYLKDWSIIQGSFICVVSLCHPILIPFLWESNELVSFYACVMCLGLHDFIITIWYHILFMTILDASLYDILMCLLTISCIWYISCHFTYFFSLMICSLDYGLRFYSHSLSHLTCHALLFRILIMTCWSSCISIPYLLSCDRMNMCLTHSLDQIHMLQFFMTSMCVYYISLAMKCIYAQF